LALSVPYDLRAVVQLELPQNDELARFTYEVRAVTPYEWRRERPDADFELDDMLQSFGKEYEDELRREVEATATLLFGPRVRVEAGVRRGSVFVDIVLYGWPVLLGAKQIVETLQWYYRAVEGIVRRIFGRFRDRHYVGVPVEIEITGDWVPSGRVLQPVEESHPEPALGHQGLLLGYLVLSNVLLIGLLAALVIAKLF
jgi:hypothetical protein